MIDYVVLPYCLLLCVRLLPMIRRQGTTRSILARDKHRCRACDRRCPTLEVYAVGDTSDSPQLSLCRTCHTDAESRGLHAETVPEFLTLFWIGG